MKLAVGFFDGVHRGHQAILNGADAALTFLNHPLTVLAPDKAPRLIMSLEERLRAIALPVTVLPFDAALSKMSAADFAAQYLAGRVIRCGENWRFGAGGEGNAEWLSVHGYEVEVVPYAEFEGAPISSSRIRAALERGEMEKAAAMLGRPYAVSGAMFAGKGEGHRLGYPTINLRPGVYQAEVAGQPAIANYGVAPTFGERAWTAPVLEVHLIKYLREERKFDSIDALKSQIAADIDKCQKNDARLKK